MKNNIEKGCFGQISKGTILIGPYSFRIGPVSYPVSPVTLNRNPGQSLFYLDLFSPYLSFLHDKGVYYAA